MQNGGSPDSFASRAMPPTYFYPTQFGGPTGPGGYGGPMPGAPNHFIGYHQGPSSPREGTVLNLYFANVKASLCIAAASARILSPIMRQ